MLHVPAMKARFVFAAVLLLAGCATPPPSGPSIMALPGTGKTFDQFRLDDSDCRQYASAQIGGTNAQQASVRSGIGSAAIGTAVGAAVGGLAGGNRGAGVGAGIGMAGGAIAGTQAANTSAYTVQERYDIGYTQCMYAKGNQVPMSGRYVAPANGSTAPAAAPPPPPPPASTAPR